MTILWFFEVLALLGIFTCGLQLAAVHSALKKESSGSKGKGSGAGIAADGDRAALPPISVLKPLKGVDDRLFDNIESICLQDYPCYEIILTMQDRNDPAYKVATMIREKYPDKDITVLVERCDAGLNPKVNNLIPAYDISKYDLVLISDSNVMVRKEYLREISAHMQNPDVGLVSNLIRGVGGRSIGSVFENLHMNSFVAGSVCFLDHFLKMPCVVGKSMLMRKSNLAAIGGLDCVKNVLAEDYVLGEKMHNAGKKVVLSGYIIDNVNEYWGLGKFLNRHIRWGKLRWKIGGARYVVELLTNAVFMSSLPLLFTGLSEPALSILALVSLVKAGCDYLIGKELKSEIRPLLYLLTPAKDILAGVIWFFPIISNEVVWRGNKYIIGKNSMLSPYAELRPPSLSLRLVYAIKTRLAWESGK